MRINLNLSRNNEIVPFNYQHLLIGTFHKWMGVNEIHNNVSLYSLSWLNGGEATKNGLNFNHGANWFISFWDEEIGKQLIFNAMKEPDLFCGLNVNEIVIQNEPNFTNKERFLVASPVLIRKYTEDRKAIHLTYDNLETDLLLTNTLKRKLSLANLNDDVKVSFDRTYNKAKTKVVTIKNIQNKANLCPVIIEGDTESLKFAWNVGIGHGTGSAFGALY